MKTAGSDVNHAGRFFWEKVKSLQFAVDKFVEEQGKEPVFSNFS
jgi:hypothetical protein